MTDDYRVKKRSNAEVRALAKRAREFFGVAEHRCVDIVSCLKHKKIWTVKGEKALYLNVKLDSEMGHRDGLTEIINDTIEISIKESVQEKAIFGDGRSRNTLAHELGHGVMYHDRAPMARNTLGNLSPNWIQPYESAEHHVKIFAPAFLINDSIARTLSSAEEISTECGISLESAKIFFGELVAERDRGRNAEKMQQIAREFRLSVTGKSDHQEIRYLTEICSVCRNQTLFPIGIKVMCRTCDTVFDRFQDGDSLDV